ncbi:MAG: glycosyl hydrolase, partial [Sulfurimonas sp.]|uniref:glycosyl hydrolase n=1 Tax=Sulfurimonas sp. TaxID=2022749 RepID=UPI0028CE1231
KPYKWDNYSDQPYPLQDKNYKKQMRKSQIGSLLKTFLTSLAIIPFSIIMTPFVKRKKIDSNEFFCLGVDFERNPKETLEMIEELDVDRILLRIKLWEMEKLPLLKDFILLCRDKKVTLKILQDREHIEDLSLLQNDLETIFASLNQHVDLFEIGSTINRAKWGFFSVDEYSRFYKVAYDLKISKFPHLKLIGSGVIDFEYHFSAHTLFNLYDYKYDGISSLLYVDRRGAPENMQMGFNLQDKISLLSTMVWLSPKSNHKLHITETNWPISGTAPYAPTSEYECVSEELYSDYMLRYYLLALASQQVDSVSWHQLIAPGYGLVDNREGIKKRSAYTTYKFMVQNLKNSQFLRLDIKRGYYILQFLVDNMLLQIHWSLKPTTLKNEDFFTVFSHEGERIESQTLNIGSSPLYIYVKDSV